MRQFAIDRLPEDVKEAFFDQYDHIGNDCWVEVCVEWDEDSTDELDVLTAWLKKKGVKNGATVLIEHMW